MDRKALVRAMADRVRLAEADLEAILDLAFNIIGDGLAKDGNVVIAGLGTFSVETYGIAFVPDRQLADRFFFRHGEAGDFDTDAPAEADLHGDPTTDP
jgi:hypothetical protein